MRRSSIGFVALLLALAVPHLALAAQGLNLAWNHCQGEGTGVQNLAFACDTNSGTSVLTGSFILSSDYSPVSGMEIILDLAAASATLPAWWEFHNAGSCRQSSLHFDILGDLSESVCQDPWFGHSAAGGIAAYCGQLGTCVDHPSSANVVRFKAAAAVPPSQLMSLSVGTEYFAFHLGIDHARTVGTGSCGGCATPVCIVLNTIRLSRPTGLGDRFMGAGSAPGSNVATWQGGGSPVNGANVGCPAATATHRSAWAEVKSLYR